jgi:hypothetical protein
MTMTAMRAAILMLLVAGCLPSGSSGPDMAVPPPDLLPPPCARECMPSCLPGFMCVRTTEAQEYAAFCGSSCSSSTECGMGGACVQLVGLGGVPPVCVKMDSPTRCPAVPADAPFSCTPPAATCKSSTVLARPFMQMGNRLCGSELIECANGCMDGGGDGGAAARCL